MTRMPSFSYNGHTYDIVESALTWSQAGAEAQRRGGYLAVVSTAEENLAIYQHAAPLLGHTPSAPDGGGSRYVWIGGSDALAEGDWRWGDGSALASGYVNWGEGSWGEEPYDEGGQDALAMGLERWPNGTGGLGSGGQWNDLAPGNLLYFVVERGPVDDPRVDGVALYSSSAIPALPAALSDLILTGANPVTAYGNSLANLVEGNAGGNRLYGLAGADTINGNAGADLLDGGEDDDALLGNDGSDRLRGGSGNDTLDGGAGYDRLAGGAGDDFYRLSDGNGGDRVSEKAGEGDDEILADTSCRLPREIERLWLTGSSDVDGIGNAGGNALTGNDGTNRLLGKAGSDTLEGGAGSDSFCFDTRLGEDVDTVVDFVSGEDRLYLSRRIFGPAHAGALAEEALTIGWEAEGAATRIVFDADTGTLYFDRDGAGGVAAVPFAVLSGVSTMLADDFLLY